MKKIYIIAIIIILSIVSLINFIPIKDNNMILQIQNSPDNTYQAVIFERNINATTKTSYHLSILKNGRKLGDSRGNIFVSYHNFDVEWIDNNTLKIKNFKESSEFKKIKRYKNIDIIYLE